MTKRTTPLIAHVDDRETNRYTVRRFLEKAGFEVEQADNGADGKALIKATNPDLIILDVKLPDISGFELCRQLKSDPATSGIPIMQVSAHFTDQEARVEGLEAGADAYLTSINPNELVATVRALLRAHQAEERATARAAEWQTTFDSVSDPIFIMREDHSILRANTAGEELLTCSVSAERERLIQELCLCCSEPSGVSETAGVRELSTCGRIFRVRVDRVEHPASDAAGNWVCVLADITDFRTAEKEIRRMNEQLVVAKDAAVQANRAKSTFLASMSHELRTPLNAIIGYTEILQEDASQSGDVRIVDDLARINQSARHLLTMVSEILDLSRIEAGRTKLNLDGFQALMVVQEAVTAVLPLAQQRGNSIQISGDAGTIWSDSAKLHQIVLNLVGNACKFTSGGEIHINVMRLVEDAKEWVRFEIEDTGIGIETAKLASIFEAYAQAETDRKYVFGGSGLGLSISRRLAELLGGTLTVMSTRGKGSIFTLKILANLQEVDHLLSHASSANN